jgi:hypothetical protein
VGGVTAIEERLGGVVELELEPHAVISEVVANSREAANQRFGMFITHAPGGQRLFGSTT